VAIPEPGPLLRSLAPAPEAIEPLSLQRLEADAPALPWSGDDRTMALRLAYAVADPAILGDLIIAPSAIEAGVTALLAGRPIVVDIRMVEQGISYPAVKRLGVDLRCAIDAPDVVQGAHERGITRSAQAMLARVDDLHGAIVAVGNAPTALLALLDLIDAGVVRPALVLGFPVGYVAATESKAELERRDVPFITLRGRRGGTPLAVAAVNTLLRLAVDRAPHTSADAASATPTREAVLLIGHGSRQEDASRAMERVAAVVAARAGCIVEAAYLQMVSPTVLEGIDACVARGAQRIAVMPYFLHAGRHVLYDLPALLDQAAHRHPGIELALTQPLGFSDALADLVLERVASAAPHRVEDRAEAPHVHTPNDHPHTHAATPLDPATVGSVTS
jgi:precorrin-8X/cobalt-precorrin-8 methylmutase